MHRLLSSQPPSLPRLPRSIRSFSGSRRIGAACLIAAIASLLINGGLRAETSVQSAHAHQIAFLIWDSDFSAALDSCHNLIRHEAMNPLGYCLLGITYHSINSQFRTNRYADSVMWDLDTAIALADGRNHSDDGYSDYLFVMGSAYGYRALEQSTGGHWWAAFKDGHRSCSFLQKAYQKDTSLAAALLGIGDYHYWKSAKSKVVTWLPFVKDRRELGISEIKQVTQSGNGADLNAVKSLLPIYLNEQQYPLVIKLVDSLDWSGYTDPSCLLHKIKAEIGLANWDMASRTLSDLHQAWISSPYFDSCGACEADYLKACILAGRGDNDSARKYIQEILARKDSCESNTYFRETVASAQELFH